MGTEEQWRQDRKTLSPRREYIPSLGSAFRTSANGLHPILIVSMSLAALAISPAEQHSIIGGAMHGAF